MKGKKPMTGISVDAHLAGHRKTGGAAIAKRTMPPAITAKPLQPLKTRSPKQTNPKYPKNGRSSKS